MERLTKKHDGSGSYTQFGDKYIPNHNIRHKQCVEKLGKLEDIEQELGIPLEVLFKALKDGIYRLYEEFEDEPPSIYYLDPIIMYDEYRKCWIFYDDGKCQVYCLKDYGKTWALTRGELEDDN